MKINIIAWLVFISVLFSAAPAFALLDCRVAIFQRNAANQDYQDTLAAAEGYPGGDYVECTGLWCDYQEACEDYAAAQMVFWHSCVEPNILNPVLREARETAFEAALFQMMDDCQQDYAEALTSGCL